MYVPIIDSIINGQLNPNMATDIPFVEICRALNNNPTTLTEAETLLKNQLGKYVSFSYDDDRPFVLGKGRDEFISIPQYSVPIYTQLQRIDPATPQERFYVAIVKAESNRTMLALMNFVNTAATTDSKGEIKRTLENIYHLSKQYASFGSDNVIMYRVKQDVFSLYYRIAYTFDFLFDNQQFQAIDDFYYELFGEYPGEDVTTLLQSAILTAQIQSDIHIGRNDISVQLTHLTNARLQGSTSMKPLVIWLENKLFAISMGYSLDGVTGSTSSTRDLVRNFKVDIKSKLSTCEDETEVINILDGKINILKKICGDDPVDESAATKAYNLLSQMLEEYDKQEGNLRKNKMPKASGLSYIRLFDNSEAVRDLFNFLVKQQKIDSSTTYVNFRQVFSGYYATQKILWTGDISDLSAMFKSMKDQKVLENVSHIWKDVAQSFEMADGRTLTSKNLAGQNLSQSHISFGVRAANLLSA